MNTNRAQIVFSWDIPTLPSNWHKAEFLTGGAFKKQDQRTWITGGPTSLGRSEAVPDLATLPKSSTVMFATWSLVFSLARRLPPKQSTILLRIQQEEDDWEVIWTGKGQHRWANRSKMQLACRSWVDLINFDISYSSNGGRLQHASILSTASSIAWRLWVEPKKMSPSGVQISIGSLVLGAHAAHLGVDNRHPSTFVNEIAQCEVISPSRTVFPTSSTPSVAAAML